MLAATGVLAQLPKLFGELTDLVQSPRVVGCACRRKKLSFAPRKPPSNPPGTRLGAATGTAPPRRWIDVDGLAHAGELHWTRRLRATAHQCAHAEHRGVARERVRRNQGARCRRRVAEHAAEREATEDRHPAAAALCRRAPAARPAADPAPAAAGFAGVCCGGVVTLRCAPMLRPPPRRRLDFRGNESTAEDRYCEHQKPFTHDAILKTLHAIKNGTRDGPRPHRRQG